MQEQGNKFDEWLDFGANYLTRDVTTLILEARCVDGEAASPPAYETI